MNIVAIGGGERTPHVKKALELTGDEAPSALIIPTASSTKLSFDKKVALYKQTFDGLGVPSEVLHQFEETPSHDEIMNKIGNASLLYTYGGNSPYMIRKMAEHGSNALIGDAIRNGKVHAGLSAGALLPFRFALSNPAKRPAEEEWEFELLEPGVDLVDAVVTAHADAHDLTLNGPRVDSRAEALLRIFPNEASRGYAISNNASAIFGDNAQTFLNTPDAFVDYIYRDENGELKKRPAEPSDLSL